MEYEIVNAAPLGNNSALQTRQTDGLKESVKELLNVADMTVNSTYLTTCARYKIQRLDDSVAGLVSKTKLFRLKRFVYNPEESVMEKLKTFYLSLSHLPLNPSIFMMINNQKIDDIDEKGKVFTKSEFSIYLGIRTEYENLSHRTEDMFKESFLGTFLGSELESVEMKDLSLEDPCSLACVSAIPSVKMDTDRKTAPIGLEQFIDVMRNENYTAILIAAPADSNSIQQRKRVLENLYSKLSIVRKQTLSYGENQSLSVSKGINNSISTSTTNTESFTHTASKSHTTSEGGGHSNTWSYEGGSDGTSSNWNESETFGFSDSEGSSKAVGVAESRGTQENIAESKGSSKQITIEYENKNVVNMLEKIDEALKHINDSEAYGLWDCAAYFAADNVTTSMFAANAYKALVLGENSSASLSYINCWDGKEQADNVADLFSYVKYGIHPVLTRTQDNSNNVFKEINPTQAVSGKDLPYFLTMPQKSIPGIVVDSIAAFERSVHVKKQSGDAEKKQEERIRLGTIFHMGHPEESSEVSLELNKFTGHCFISGSTGSGKSNTMAKLIQEIILKKPKVGFLVIEPAKGEYKKDFHELENINIFSTNPFCEQLLHLNPFRFHRGIHVLEHVDRLLNIFGSCWELTAAMPAILKKAVEQSYENIGWDLCNSYYMGDGETKYPTFATVVNELREIIDKSDYSAEAKGNYTGALVTRVESLSGGILKRIFCNETDISYEVLFDGRTIIDLSRLGSPETKTLIMGVLVMLLSEYRMAVAQETNATNQDLRHITVLEEAHNLLKNVDASQNGSGLIAKSIEMISNAIAEMRTYGEGFIIVDQSPTAVDISVIKNTNTKIVMRLPEQHDCEAMANAMGLNEFQKKEIAKLLPWKAVVMQNDWTASVMVAIDKAQNNLSGTPEIITAEENRIVRSRLALEFARLAHCFYYALSRPEDVLSPDMLIDGISVEGWRKNALSILDEAVSDFKESKGRSGIGKAKANELRNLCNYYWETLISETKESSIKCVGRLILAVLACEDCWKIYLDKTKSFKIPLGVANTQRIATVDAAIEKSRERLPFKEIHSLRNILSFYISSNAESKKKNQLLGCVKACMCDGTMLASLGAPNIAKSRIPFILKHYDNFNFKV